MISTIFLDVDGVLNDHVPQPNKYCGIKPSCVAALNKILDAVPGSMLVISSAWRYMICPEAMTLKGFEYMLLAAGVNCFGRVAGHTVRDEEVRSRGEQITRWLVSSGATAAPYVALDDMEWDFHKWSLPHVKTDPGVGLTDAEAQQAIEILTK